MTKHDWRNESRPKCTEARPMPDGLSDADRSRWSHPDMRVIYEGLFLDTIECPNCGLSVKAAKRP